MKRLSLLLISVALLFGMTQCKKKVETITPAATIDETVHITLDVNGGGKYEVYPSTGAVVYTDGDVIYVGNNGKYVGSLTYANGAFSGTLTGVVTTDYLHFFFVSGLTPSTTPSAGSTASFTVNISDQSSALPVLSYGKSNIMYTSGTTAYSSILENKCGLVKFEPSIAIATAITVNGMKTEATINFSGSITPTATTGGIKLYSESDEAKWAILLPQDEVASATVSIVGYEASSVSVPGVTENMYYTSGVDIAFTKFPYIDAVFTVGSTTIGSGTTVHFSKGNLQYLGTGTSGDKTPSWRFADNQYDYMGNGSTSGNVTISGYSAYNTGSTAAVGSETDADKQAARDLFGWGSSGGGTIITYPYSTMSNGSWSSYYGGTSHIAGTNYDWGVYLRYSAQNLFDGGDNSWRTLTSTEWSNLFNRTKTVTTSSGSASKTLYGYATVMGVKGIIVLPDSWDGSLATGFTYAGTDYGANVYSTSDAWEVLEDAGAVFLPAAGYRSGASLSNIGSQGFYWTSSVSSSNSERAFYVFFRSGEFGRNYILQRYSGSSVRLVFECS